MNTQIAEPIGEAYWLAKNIRRTVSSGKAREKPYEYGQYLKSQLVVRVSGGWPYGLWAVGDWCGGDKLKKNINEYIMNKRTLYCKITFLSA